MSPSAGDHSGPAGPRGLLACFEAPRVREEAKVFHERVHDAYKIGMLPANASLRATQAFTRGGAGPARTVAGCSLFRIDAAFAGILRCGTEAAIKASERQLHH
jgi:hypothetical protein